MKSDFESRFGALESLVDNLGNTGDQPAVTISGEVDTASLMILINKNAAEIKSRASSVDLEALRQKVNTKADQ